jgi:hypothetical protein
LNEQNPAGKSEDVIRTSSSTQDDGLFHKRRLARDAITPAKARAIARHGTTRERELVALNESGIPLDVFVSLAEAEEDVAAALIANSSTPTEVIVMLARRFADDGQIIGVLSRHPNALLEEKLRRRLGELSTVSLARFLKAVGATAAETKVIEQMQANAPRTTLAAAWEAITEDGAP